MKISIIVFALLLHILPKMTFGQDSRYVGVELLGNGGLYSINYLHDFSSVTPKSFLGFRAGLGVIPSTPFERFGLTTFRTQYLVPLGVHYTILDRLEFGLGVTVNVDIRGREENGERTNTTEFHTWLVPSIGYRKPLGEKWLFKATLTPIIRSESDGGGWFPWLGVTFAKRLN